MKIAIYGYGNLGRGVELAIRQNPDTELFGIFTRRDPKTVKTLTGAPVPLQASHGARANQRVFQSAARPDRLYWIFGSGIQRFSTAS